MSLNTFEQKNFLLVFLSLFFQTLNYYGVFIVWCLTNNMHFTKNLGIWRRKKKLIRSRKRANLLETVDLRMEQLPYYSCELVLKIWFIYIRMLNETGRCRKRDAYREWVSARGLAERMNSLKVGIIWDYLLSLIVRLDRYVRSVRYIRYNTQVLQNIPRTIYLLVCWKRARTIHSMW